MVPPASDPEQTTWEEPGPFITDTSVTDSGGWPEPEPAVSFSTATVGSLPPVPIGPSDVPGVWSRSESAVSAREWPAARDILAAHCRHGRPKPAEAVKPTARRAQAPPCAHDRLRARTLEGAALARLGAADAGHARRGSRRDRAWPGMWSKDARTAGLIANHLAASAPGAKFPLKPDEIPSGPWWKSTAGNLARLAVALERTGDPGMKTEGEALLHTATHASPFQASARFALAHLPEQEGRPGSLALSLGLSRDVVSLAWSGHQLLKAGKKDAALRAYRAALEMAATAEVARLAAPTYNDDPLLHRYNVPGEDLIGAVVRDMAEQTEWTYADWSAALPRYAVAPLVAARVLSDADRTASDAALNSIVARADEPPPPGTSAALHLAAQAEAFALRSDWTTADALYRQAIDQMPSPRVRRAWWVNVADIALRLDDEFARQKALEAANSHDPNDEITRRVVELQKFSGNRGEKAAPRARTASKAAEKS